MLRPRIVPCLLIHEGGLVKTVRFRDPTYVGDPINAVRIFNEKESDELVVLDIDASANGVEPDFKLIEHLAAECRMPLCYGGGVTTVDQAKRIISLGVEKVALSSAAVANPDLISAIADSVGRQSTVVVIDTRKRTFGSNYDVYTHNGTRKTGLAPTDFAQQAEARGAGEIIVNSIDRDGTLKGYDVGLARQMRAAVNTPLSFLGGAGRLEDIESLIREVGVVGASAGSLFVFKGKYRAVLINYPQPASKEELVQRAMRA
ncbi:AglZ/HisF2 family acetamidino modification protein [Altererythrobacter arenosus]|uniref:Imidazole glycerol phosphate synthase subunit HisF n=1 Tax=Altererythrobacter arenosus TaxID=3032592 RepID=A0ABY8FZA2_9SPHN|nr:AglZ/HisF2 family acetamidino modification protein [Altererythrobacter sp. CAU 1644]WFL78721.1 AglZ/HisF2 family acetamidino modification protein [Altererythrobacter sp. CAU 1644]